MKRALLFAVLVCLAGAAAASDRAQLGGAVVSSVPEGDRTAVTLQDPAGHSFTVSLSEDPPAEIAAQVAAMKDLFFSWRNVTVGSLRFTLTGSLIEAVLFPQQLTVNGKDLRPYVPGGLYFTYSKSLGLQYDFRVTKDNLFLRVSGSLNGEEGMEQKIADALANPSAYLQRSDTEYLLSRIDEAQTEIAALQGEVDGLTASLVSANATLDALRYAEMTRENVEWLFFPTPIPKDGIAKVVALKKESPSLTRAQAAEALKGAGIAMSDQEISLVFKYYFGE